MMSSKKGGSGEGIMVDSKLGSTWLGAEIVQVHGSLTQSDVDCFCSSPLPVSTHFSSLWHHPSRWHEPLPHHPLMVVS